MELSPLLISALLWPNLQDRFIQKNCFPNPVNAKLCRRSFALLCPAHTSSLQITSHLVLQPVSQPPALDRQTDRQGCHETQFRQRRGYPLSHQWICPLASWKSHILQRYWLTWHICSFCLHLVRNKRVLNFLMAPGLLPGSLNVKKPGSPPHSISQSWVSKD